MDGALRPFRITRVPALALALAFTAGCANIPEKTSLTAFRSGSELAHYLRRSTSEGARPRALARSAGVPRPADITDALRFNPQIGTGEIVKPYIDNLVILGRGQLLTVSIKGGQMTPVDAADAFPQGAAVDESVYNDMLIVGDLIVAIGYRGAQDGVLVSRFRIDNAGHLQFVDCYELRLEDSGSTVSWRSGRPELIVYSQGGAQPSPGNPVTGVPSIRRWGPDGPAEEFRPIANPGEIYSPVFRRRARDAGIDALHAITNCDLTAPVVTCRSTGIVGSQGDSFYPSGDAIYVWTEDRLRQGSGKCAGASLIYRLPLDAGIPSATRAGHPLCPR
jgi:hypothetical protein